MAEGDVIVREPVAFNRYDESGWRKCSDCGTNYVYLNKYGYCAACWVGLDDDERDALAVDVRIVTKEVRTEVQTTTVHEYHWRPSGLLLAISSTLLGAAAGGVTAWAVVRHFFKL